MTRKPYQHICIADRDTPSLERYSHYLEKRGFEVSTTSNVTQLYQLLEQDSVDLLLLDVTLADADGWLLLSQLHAQYSSLGLILTTRNTESPGRVAALEAGADDYLVKPLEERTLLASVEALSRRLPKTRPQQRIERMYFADWCFNLANYTLRKVTRPLRKEALELPLTKTEYRILIELLSHPHRVRTRQHLLSVLENVQNETSRSLDVQISRLRQKLGDEQRQIIATVHGMGYVFRGDVRAE